MIPSDAIKRHCENDLQKEGTRLTASLRSVFKSLELEDKKCCCWQES